MPALELIIFLLGSIGIILLSWRSFKSQYTHGFPRFFAFESILGLVAVNARHWLTRPLSMLQIISWLLLALSIYLVISSVWLLRRFGEPDHSLPDPAQVAFEKTTHLVTRGPFRFIRHPMYASLLYFSLGVFLKQVSLLSALLVIIASLALFLTAVYEERENLAKFGDEYATYMQNSKRFIPFIF